MQCAMGFNQNTPLAIATVKDVTNSDVYIGSQYAATYTDSGHTYYPVTNSSSSSSQSAALATFYNMIFHNGYSVCLNAAGTSFFFRCVHKAERDVLYQSQMAEISARIHSVYSLCAGK